MPTKLKRYYGTGDLHFITCSCYHRLPLLATARARDIFVKILGEVRDRYQFPLVGFVVMPDHIHLLIGEPQIRTPSTVMQVLKQRVSRQLLRSHRNSATCDQSHPPTKDSSGPRLHFWEHRFYDFNVWSRQKRNEKLHYMHNNPVKRGLVTNPKDWPWSSYRFYASIEPCLLSMDPA